MLFSKCNGLKKTRIFLLYYNHCCNKSRRCRQSLLKQGFSIWTALFHTVSVCSPSHSYKRKGTQPWLQWWISSQTLVLPLSLPFISLWHSLWPQQEYVYFWPLNSMDWKKKTNWERDLKKRRNGGCKGKWRWERTGSTEKCFCSIEHCWLSYAVPTIQKYLTKEPHKATDDRFIHPVSLVGSCLYVRV